jgi:hypothetical protein
LQVLAGPAAGPNGGQVFIDGFTTADGMPPNKNAIREIRVNPNPFSAEFDTLGTGHIEILTNPPRRIRDFLRSLLGTERVDRAALQRNQSTTVSVDQSG